MMYHTYAKYNLYVINWILIWAKKYTDLVQDQLDKHCFSGISSACRDFLHIYCIIFQYTVTMPYKELK